MKKILLIKISSLGDIIHTLPALSDAREAIADFQVDWVVDKNFQEAAAWHPAVRRTILSEHRQWRKTPLRSLPSLARFLKNLQEEKYSLILDGQGSLKSAIFAFCAKGSIAGFDRHSIREKPAHLFYEHSYSVAKNLHAIKRLRLLFSQCLGYPLPISAPHFAIPPEKLIKPSFDIPSPFLMFIPNAGWKTKLWPESHWKELISLTNQQGYTVLIPSGTPEERIRADRLTNPFPKAWALPRLSLSEIGYLLTQAQGCVSVDTGLSHLAGALDVPTVTLYGATDPQRIGVYGEKHKHLFLTKSCSPCLKRFCRLQRGLFHKTGRWHPFCNTQKQQEDSSPPCLFDLTPEKVFYALKEHLRITDLSNRIV